MQFSKRTPVRPQTGCLSCRVTPFLARAVWFVSMVLIFVPAFMSEVSANDKRPVPKPLTMEEKVKGSDLIFIGETTRVFFTDRDRNELEKDPENPRYSSTWLRVRVKKTLYSKEPYIEQEMTIYYPNDGAEGPYLRERYVGKDWIYFIRFERVLMKKNGEIIRTNTPMFTPGRWIVYPHALEEAGAVAEAVDGLNRKRPRDLNVK